MARSLAKANVRKAIKLAQDDTGDPDALAPGYMRLFRYYEPQLDPGLYGIEAKQTVVATVDGTASTLTVYNYDTPAVAPTDPNNPTAPLKQQMFNVIAPQFQIDPKLVNSFYPPQGHTDEGRVLPHIVFNDPHLPWDRPIQGADTVSATSDATRSATSTSTSTSADAPPSRIARDAPPPLTGRLSQAQKLFEQLTASSLSKVPADRSRRATTAVPLAEKQTSDNPYLPPWIALVVFDTDELKLSQTDETNLGMPPSTTPPPNLSTPPPTPPPGTLPQVGVSPSHVSNPGAYPMTVGNYLSNITSKVNYESGYSASASGQAVYAALQQSTDPTNIIFPTKALAGQIFSTPLKFLLTSHVRQINTVGFPDAGVEEEGIFSICISHRSGPTTYPASNPNPVPVTQVVHLVSVEYLTQTSFAFQDPTERIGLVSLYSWTYLSVPPNPVNFLTTMTNLADGMQMLRPPDPVLQSLEASVATETTPELKSAATHLSDRLSRGYTITRWRNAVGEETVAYTRGPLTPLPTPWKPSIADDWPGSSNSGKDYQILDQDLGVMDVSYSSAWQLGKLMAIADNVFNNAVLRFRSLVHQAAASQTRLQVNAVASKRAVLGNLANTVDGLHGALKGIHRPKRIILPSTDKVAPPLSDPRIAPIYDKFLTTIIGAQTAAGEAIYSDYNLGNANNTDWEIIQNWISDKLFLSGIPAHYMITDPSMLPSEALRFFYIDNAWLDCFIDGALSVANHLEPVDDKVRRRIKDVYNVYLQNNIDPAPIKPPVPCYGFILRSALLQVMPDIKVTVTCRTSTPPYVADTTRAPLVRLTKLDNFTLLALLDCFPEEILSITFTQPPHQQRFVAGAPAESAQPYALRQLFSSNAPTGAWPALPDANYPSAVQMAEWYDPTTRCLDIVQMASDITTAIKSSDFDDVPYDSVTLALELNDPTYQLELLPPSGSIPNATPDQGRQLWVGVDIDDPEDPIPPAQNVIIGVSPILKPIPPAAPASAARKATSKPSSFTVHPHSADGKPVAPPAPLNFSARPAIPRAIKPSLQSKTAIAPQFSLAVHPDYRGPAPLPDTSTSPTTWSAYDYIPTGTIYLFDLIFSIQRSATAPPAGYPLSSLTLVIPTDTATGSDPPEPLVQGTYAGAGATMLHNKHLVPLLASAPGLLQVTIVPRSADPGAVASLPDTATADASFRLAQPPIAQTQIERLVQIVGLKAVAGRGVSTVQLTETYLLPDSTTLAAVSSWDLLKRDGGDTDLEGLPV